MIVYLLLVCVLPYFQVPKSQLLVVSSRVPGSFQTWSPHRGRDLPNLDLRTTPRKGHDGDAGGPKWMHTTSYHQIWVIKWLVKIWIYYVLMFVLIPNFIIKAVQAFFGALSLQLSSCILNPFGHLLRFNLNKITIHDWWKRWVSHLPNHPAKCMGHLDRDRDMLFSQGNCPFFRRLKKGRSVVPFSEGRLPKILQGSLLEPQETWASSKGTIEGEISSHQTEVSLLPLPSKSVYPPTLMMNK